MCQFSTLEHLVELAPPNFLLIFCGLLAALPISFLFLGRRRSTKMIGQAEVRTRSWGAYANLKRDLTIADLKPNVASHDASSRPVTRAPFQGLKESGGIAVSTPPSSSSSIHEQASPRPDIPTTQTVLMLYQPRTRYALTPKHETPSLHFDDEVLIKVKAIGLNPIDWKAP